MAANLDHLDLNSDAVSVDPEYDVRGFPKTLSKVGDFDGEVDLEAENGRGSRGEVTGDGVALMQEEEEEAVENEARSVNEAKEDGTPSSVFVDTVSQEQNAGSLRGAVGVVVGEKADVLLGKGVDHVPAELAADAIDNPAMEIDRRDKSSENQTECRVLDGGDFQESDEIGNKSNELNIVEVLNASANQTMKGSKVKPEFSVADLVWGKVRSHPWWPGQICDPSTSSKKARKYHRKDCFLVAYFGDQTFAWNEASKIKHLGPHFSQMEQQSNLEDFHNAIDCALDEISRRVEFGLACPCVPEYSKIKTQIIVNAGIREECSRRDGGDSFLTAVSFEPEKLVEYVKALGQFPFGGMDRFEFATVQAQLLAFNRSKGYSNLPEFQMLGVLLESDAEMPLPAKGKNRSERNENVVTKAKDNNHASAEKGKPKSQCHMSRKRKNVLEDSGHQSKKEKSLAEVVAERRLSVSNGKSGMDKKATGKLISPSLGKKRKAVDSNSNDLAVKKSKNLTLSGSDDKSSQPKKTYRVGDSILRVASQLNGSTPILKYVIGASEETTWKNKNNEKSLTRKSQGKKLFSTEDTSPAEMVSQLCLVACNPMKGCSLLKSIINFFVEFRNSVCPEPLILKQHDLASQDSIFDDVILKESTKLEKSQLDHVKDVPTVALESAVGLGSNWDFEPQIAGGVTDAETVKMVDNLEEKCNDDPTPGELILNFTDLKSVPSAANLNKIFSRFGPLKESKTKVLKKTSPAKVVLVFCRRADAQAAFSSHGKYSIFGPSLLSYSLRDVPSTPCKSSPGSTISSSHIAAASAQGNTT